MDMQKIKQRIEQFSHDRNWDQFHNPKNLAMALSVETAELVEIFQWLTHEQAKDLPVQKKGHLKEEMADIMVYLLRISYAYGIDMEEAIHEKMDKNEKKYPLFDEMGKPIVYGKKK